MGLEIRFEGSNASDVARWLGSDIPCRHQGPGDLGERMQRAFLDAFQRGQTHVVLVGTDIPGLTCEMLSRAFDALRRCPVVLGPATDGGYYLIGARETVPDLFSGIAWGTPMVLHQTIEAARSLDIHPELLDPLSDVDRPEDLSLFPSLCDG